MCGGLPRRRHGWMSADAVELPRRRARHHGASTERPLGFHGLALTAVPCAARSCLRQAWVAVTKVVTPTPTTVNSKTRNGRPSVSRLWMCSGVAIAKSATPGKASSEEAEEDECAAAPRQRPRRGEQRDAADRLLRQAAARRPRAERRAGRALHAQRPEAEDKAGQPSRRGRRHRRRQRRVDDHREGVEPPAGDEAVHRRHPRLQLARLARRRHGHAPSRQMEMRQDSAPHDEQPGRGHDDADDRCRQPRRAARR